MSEIRIFYREDNRLKLSKDIEVLKRAPRENLLWIDLNDVTEEAESRLEQFLKIYIQEEEEMEEIEISSRYMETENSLVANSRFLLSNFEEETVSFIIKDNTLVSVRSQELPSFNDTMRKLFASPRSYPTGYHVLTTLLETRVDYDADLIEDLTREITELSSHLKSEEDVDNAILIAIKELQERTMIIRENIVDKQRVCSNMIKSILIPADAKAIIAKGQAAQAARVAVLAQACSRSGAFFAGLAGACAAIFRHTGHTGYVRAQVLSLLLACGASLFLALCGWVAERWCVVEGDDDDENLDGYQASGAST